MLTVGNKNGNMKSVLMLSPDKIFPNPSQPRRDFDEDELMGLAESINKNGILQPLSVRKRRDGGFELIAGERRLRAARLAGLSSIPCIELAVDERRSAVLALLENLQRQDLSCFEEADGYARLLNDWGVTQQEASSRLGKSQSAIANKLRLLKLTPDQRERISAARLSERHARALLRVEDNGERDRLLNEVIANTFTVSETERLVDNLLCPPEPDPEPEPVQKVEITPAPRRTPMVGDVRLFVNTITRAVDTMKEAGICAKTSKNESGEFIEYTIYIPKKQAFTS